jgi:hypothetical protein
VLTSIAVEGGDVKYVSATALRVGINASGANRGKSAGSEEGNERELHFECV